MNTVLKNVDTNETVKAVFWANALRLNTYALIKTSMGLLALEGIPGGWNAHYVKVEGDTMELAGTSPVFIPYRGENLSADITYYNQECLFDKVELLAVGW